MMDKESLVEEIAITFKGVLDKCKWLEKNGCKHTICPNADTGTVVIFYLDDNLNAFDVKKFSFFEFLNIDNDELLK